MPDGARVDRSAPPSYERDSPEFARVANLSDAVFAIAMTLLVLTLDAPDVPAGELAAALTDDLPQLGAFVLSFALVANVWWLHHKFFALLGEIEPGLIALNLVLLMGVALIPFPTSLIGNDPAAKAAVLPYIGVLVAVSLIYVSMLVRAHRVDAWTEPLAAGLFRWGLAGWAASISVLIVAFAVALFVPVAGLALLPLSGVGEMLVARRAPAEYRALP